jgi:MoaA/NifB/PqqE/SkfB family radical SAM enzyme
MCDYWRTPQPLSLDADEVLSFWKRRVRTRKGSVALTGGEPLLYPRLYELMRAFRPDVDHIVLSTNGILLFDHASEVARYCNKVIISVDGATRQTLRAVRGVEALDAIIAATAEIRRLSSRVRVLYKVTVQRRNFRELPAIFELAVNAGATGLALTVPDRPGYERVSASSIRSRFTGASHTAEECREFRAIAGETQRRFGPAAVEAGA